MPELDEARWSAVAGRHRSADGLFVYAVRTTGVFCRPSCPSRRPFRRNVQFFATPAEARRAGFRPCLRCRPETSGEEDPTAARVARACRLLEDSDASPELAALAQSVGWSPSHLQRVFRRCVGVSPRQYADAVRLHRVKRSLRDGSTVTAAVYDAGYGSARGFYEKASLRLGMTPSTYRAGAEGAVVNYTFAASSVGSLLVAATEQGLCSVKIGPDPAVLFENLRIEFRRADLRQADDELAEVGATVRTLADGDPIELDLPLAVRGTAFQARVWEALRRIPAGTTRSYTEVASSIGLPTAVRAVANACGANPVALVVPCHRVIRTDGSLGGYRWGIEVKAELLRRERGRATNSG